MRAGTFSSSNIWKLMSKDRTGKNIGAPGLKYIKQVKYEMDLGRPINSETDAKPTSWGKLAETYAFQLVDLSYSLVSTERLYHPTIKMWSGAPDFIRNKSIVGDIKSPYSLESFCDKIKALESLETYKDEFPEDYWQNVSNAILLEENGLGKFDQFEMIIFCPYKSELPAIREMVSSAMETIGYGKWIYYADDEQLPHLIDGGKYKNVNSKVFDIPKEDKEKLTETILQSIEKL